MILAELKKSLEEERDRLVTDLKSIARPHPGVAGEWDTQFPKFEPGESGTFGKCATCSQPIPLERLRANPAAEHDMPHEKRIES